MAILAKGTSIVSYTADDYSTGAVTYAHVQSITLPNPTADMIDITDQTNSTAARDFQPGLVDGGELAFTLLYEPSDTTHTGLSDAVLARTQLWFKVTLTDAGVATDFFKFSGYVQSTAIEAPVDGFYSMSATVKVTGVIDMPPGA